MKQLFLLMATLSLLIVSTTRADENRFTYADKVAEAMSKLTSIDSDSGPIVLEENCKLQPHPDQTYSDVTSQYPKWWSAYSVDGVELEVPDVSSGITLEELANEPESVQYVYAKRLAEHLEKQKSTG